MNGSYSFRVNSGHVPR